MISVNNVFKKYSGHKVLNGVTVDIDKDFTVILGKSGSGKTSLLNIIGALDDDYSGDIIVDGVSLKKMSVKEKANYRNKKIGFVFQDFQVELSYTVFENVELPLLLSKKNKDERREIVSEALRKVGLLENHYKQCAYLSGGEVQRVAIARAIVNNPDYILADEPTGNLDTDNGNIVIDIFKDLVKQGKKIIMVTHNLEHIKLADCVINITDGKVTDNDY